MANTNLHNAKKAKNDECLTPTQKAKRKYALKHRVPDSEFFKDLRECTDGWYLIKGFDGYEINKNGDIYFKGEYGKHKRRKPKFIKATLLSIGYYKVSLDGETKLLHRILAETFIPNPDNKPEIDHIDGNPQNNSLENLRWVSHKENLNNPISVQREIDSHTGLVSNIKGRKKVWVNKEEKKYRMI